MNQMAYYNDNKEKCLAYQKDYYNAYREERIAYQREYNKNKGRIHVRKPLAEYKINKLEAMLRRKLRQYNNSIIKENVIEYESPPVISFYKKETETSCKEGVIFNKVKNQIFSNENIIFKDTIQKDTFPPLQGYIIKQDKFIMTF